MIEVVFFYLFQGVELPVGAVPHQVDSAWYPWAQAWHKPEIGEGGGGVVADYLFQDDLKALIVSNICQFVVFLRECVVKSEEAFYWSECDDIFEAVLQFLSDIVEQIAHGLIWF